MFVPVPFVLLGYASVCGKSFISSVSTALLSALFMAQDSDPHISIVTAMTFQNFNIITQKLYSKETRNTIKIYRMKYT
jgi:hypothetical protein